MNVRRRRRAGPAPERPVGVENAARAANPNLQYVNWRADVGHSMVHLRPDRAVLESWVSPQRELPDAAVLMAQFVSPVGAPHLGPVLAPRPVTGSRQDPASARPQTRPTRPAGIAKQKPGSRDRPTPDT